MMSGHRIRPFLLRAAVVMLIVATSGCNAPEPSPSPSPIPTPDLSAEEYQELVSVYFTGVIALEVGDPSGALEKLEAAAEIAPAEPAVWADLAIARMRAAGDVDGASQAIHRAMEITPENPVIVSQAARLALSQGNPAQAISLTERAIALAPTDPRARFLQVEAYRQQGGDGWEDEVRTALEQLADVDPSNTVVRLQAARAALQSDAADEALRHITALTDTDPDWPAEARTQLDRAEAALEGRADESPAVALAMLSNVLLPTDRYQEDLAAVGPVGGELAGPIGRFLRLPPPEPTVARADEQLRFERESAGDWDEGRPVALPLAEDGPPTMATWSGERLRLHAEPPRELAVPSPPQGPSWSPAVPADGIAVFDLNQDRLPEVAVAGRDGLVLYTQTSTGALTDITDRTGLTTDVVTDDYREVTPMDVDMDGDLDIVLGRPDGAPLVLTNLGGTTLEASQPLDVPGMIELRWADFDGDVDGDICGLVEGSLWCMENQRDGRYQPVAVTGAGRDLSSLRVADVDHDGVLDLVALHENGTVVGVPGPLSAEVASITLHDAPTGTSQPSPGVHRIMTGDFDNNGALDIVRSTGGGADLLLLDRDGGVRALPPLRYSVVGHADTDGDGRLDLLAEDQDRPLLLTNQGGAYDYHWQVIRPRGLELPEEAAGSGDQRINSYGIGGLISVRAGLLTQTAPISGPRVHFGLGTHPEVDVAYIRWPNGTEQAEFALAADRVVTATQRLKGSCPWLFAHDGDGVKFVTDILWRSPLGLRINAVDTAGVVQTRDWVRVSDDQLRPVSGQYDLRITAELWETHYFDEFALLVVDHPADHDVFVDERFAIPPPPLAIHSVRDVRPVPAATDRSGQDVTARVAERDGRTVDTFPLGAYQGVTTDHWVTIALPESGLDPQRTVLLAQGWVYPTDSSINVALAQDNSRSPEPVVLEFERPDGSWLPAGIPVGFPAGKHKTMLIDLSPALGDGETWPQRIRLRTSMEVYWDRIALATRIPDGDQRVTTLEPAWAQLRPRGFSVTSHFPGDATDRRRQPEIPNYDRIATTRPIWADLVGRYTGYGDIRELVVSTDDRYAIVNAGDEIRLRFDAPPPPVDGWRRDFVFVSDGWEKDGDLNTAYGDTVRPLPSHERPEYGAPSSHGDPVPLARDPVFLAHPTDWLFYHDRLIPEQRQHNPLVDFAPGRR